MRFFSQISESAGNTCNPERSSHTSSVKKAGGYRCGFGAAHTAVHGKGLVFVGEQQRQKSGRKLRHTVARDRQEQGTMTHTRTLQTVKKRKKNNHSSCHHPKMPGGHTQTH